MSNIINTHSLSGIFNSQTLSFTNLRSTDKTVAFEANVSNTKDPLFVIVDLSAVFVGVKINVLNTEGKVIATETLTPGFTNIFTATTFGCVKNGRMVIELECVDGNFTSDLAILVSAFSHLPVINN